MAKKKHERYLSPRPNGAWQVRMVVGVRPDGGPAQVCKTFPSRDEARAYRDAMMAAMAAGNTVSWSPTLLRDWAQQCMASFGPSLQAYTRRGYTSVIRNHIETSQLGGMPLRDIKPSHVQAWLSGLTPKNKRGSQVQSLSPKTIKNIHGVLSWLFNIALNDGLLRSNPAEKVKLPQQRKPQRKVLKPDAAKKLLELSMNTPDYASYVLDAVTGMRRSELLGLCWDCIDLDAGSYTVRRKVALDESGRLLLVNETKSEEAQRDGRLSPRVVAILKAHRQEQRKQRLAAGELWKDHDLVFCDAFGRPLNPSSYSSRFYRLQKRNGIDPPVGLHAYRHYVATRMIHEGVDILAVAALLGHADPNYTRRAYEDLYEESKQQAADIMASILD